MLKKYKLENKLLNSDSDDYNNCCVLEIAKQIVNNKYNRKIFITNLILILFLLLFLVASLIYFSFIIAFGININSNNWLTYLIILIVFWVLSACIGSYNFYTGSYIDKRIPKIYLNHKMYLYSLYSLNVEDNIFYIDKIKELLLYVKLFNFISEDILLDFNKKVNTTKLKRRFSIYFPYSMMPLSVVSFVLFWLSIFSFFKII